MDNMPEDKFTSGLGVTNLILSHYLLFSLTTNILLANFSLFASILITILILGNSST